MTRTTPMSSTATAPRRPRKMAREPIIEGALSSDTASVKDTPPSLKPPSSKPPSPKPPSRLDQLQPLLARDDGASIAEMTSATGWQPHSVRGAMAGALKKRALVITSDKLDGLRRYRASTPS